MSPRSNLITQEEMAAINGPVAREDGTLICVNSLDTGWQYSIEKPNLEIIRGGIHPTSQQARNELIPNLHADEQKLWSQPYSDLPAGKPWFGQKIGDVNISTEAIFVRATYTQNNTLTQQSMARIQRPNAYDIAGNCLAHFAARSSSVTYLKDFLKHKIVKRNNIADNSPTHFAATSPHDTLPKIVVFNSHRFPVMSKNKFNKSAVDLLNPEEQNELLPKLTQAPLLKTRVVIPQQNKNQPQHDNTRKIER